MEGQFPVLPGKEMCIRDRVYVVLKEGAKFSDVEFAIKSDSYFSHDDTRVQQVPDIDALKDMGHGVLMERKGVSGSTQNQMFTFEMQMCIRDRHGGNLLPLHRAQHQ